MGKCLGPNDMIHGLTLNIVDERKMLHSAFSAFQHNLVRQYVCWVSIAQLPCYIPVIK